ncbi:MAG: hypothetical protein JNJ61_24865 [Anaerolineae bacterium]|nr:hypothetical protein [Anaerolineae bacterium]
MARNRYQQRAKAAVRAVMRNLKDRPKLRQELQEGLDDMSRADSLYEQWIQDAKMIGVRNPSFDGDSVGWLDDDFDRDDDADDGKDGDEKR